MSSLSNTFDKVVPFSRGAGGGGLTGGGVKCLTCYLLSVHFSCVRHFTLRPPKKSLHGQTKQDRLRCSDFT